MYDKDTIQRYKSLLSNYLMDYHNIKNLKAKFRCLNPNHEDLHPSMNYTDKYNICKCFACGIKYDIFDLIELDYEVRSFKEKIEIINNLYPNINNNVQQKIEERDMNIKLVDYTNYFKKCQKNIGKTDYLIKRNIEPNLLKKYSIGYDDDKKMIIFPINKNSFFARSVIENKKIKSKGISYLWNEDLLNDTDSKTLIYVTESIIDSLSIETINPDVKTIALNGLSNYKRLIALAKEKEFKGTFVLAFDNDKMGRMYQNIVKEELTKIGVSSFSTTLISNIENCKDLNEALENYKDSLIKNYNYFDNNFKIIINKNTKEKENIIYG